MQQAAGNLEKKIDLRNQVIRFCQELIAGVLKIDYKTIKPAATFDTYGIDSIMIGQIYVKLKDSVGEIDNSVMFSCHSIDDLSDYLLKNKLSELNKLFSINLKRKNVCISPRDIPFLVPEINPREMRGTLNDEIVLQHRKAANNVRYEKKIAIIGVDGVYPGSKNLEEFWKNLASGKNCISEVPEGRWSLYDFYEPDRSKALQQGKSYCKWGGFLDSFSSFDAEFFGISEEEAYCIDPQERIFLQSAWKALESSGQTLADLKNKYRQRVGVFVGITKLGFNLYGSSETIRNKRFFPRTSFSSVANRLSYFLNISGPSMPVDTMCSSSLTAIHEACEHIKSGACELALAGGVNLYLHPYSYVDLSAQGMLSAKGRLCSFGEDADGFVPGEGVGVVVLKEFGQAIKDRDNILGVILSTHINHSGRSNGYTLPNPKSYTDLIQEAIKKAAVKHEDISYIEAHGTGTLIGDSIEIAALKEVFLNREGPVRCKLGSVKSNIGHCESAAGISAVTKVLLQFQNKKIAPSINAEKLNPHIDLSEGPFDFNAALSDWSQSGKSRIAGVSSFGAGGANAHIILQEFKSIDNLSHYGNRSNIQLFPFSAKTQEQLYQRVYDTLDYLNSHVDDSKNCVISLSDVAYTLQVGREQMSERTAFIASTANELKEKMRSYLDGDYGRGADEQENLEQQDQQKIHFALVKRDITSLSRFWTGGADVEWSELYRSLTLSQLPKRIPLPTYPFLEKSYWIFNLPESASVFKSSCDDKSTNNDDFDTGCQLSNVNRRICQQIAEVLGVSETSINKNMSFIELGMDSGGLTRLIGCLNTLFKIKLSPALFFNYPDISSLTKYLIETYPDKIGWFDHEDGEHISLNQDFQQLIVPMRAKGSKTPFFVIPGGPGNVLAMLPLSQALSEEQPFYCLQPDINLSESEFKEMNKVVSYFSEAILSVNQYCAVKLIGYSNGGVVAYELTRKLQELGVEVEQLILIDTLCPLSKRRDLLDETVDIAEKFMMSLGTKLSLDKDVFEGMTEDRRCEYLFNVMTQHGLVLDKAQFDNAYRYARASDECCRNYQPQKLHKELSITLFRATEAYPEEEADYGWSTLLGNSFRTIDIDANHFTIVHEGPALEISKYIH